MVAKAKNVDNLLIVGLDMDGVIIDNTRSKIAFAKKLGYQLTPEDTAADRIGEIVSPEDLDTLKFLLYQNPATALRAGIIDGAKNGLAALKTKGIPFYLISRRKDADIPKAILKKHGLWASYFNEENVFFVETAQEKNIQARALGVTVYFDDQASVLEHITSVPRKFLLDQFGNFKGSSPAQTCVASWSEFLAQVI